VNIVLIHPPLDDPTLPYHATAYLAGHLRSKGFDDVVMRDVNIEYVNDALTADTIHWIYQEIEHRIQNFKQAQELAYPDQEAYYRLLTKPRLQPADIADAVSTLRDKDKFLDYPCYLRSVKTLTDYMDVIGGLSYPAQNVGFTQRIGGHFSLANTEDLFDESLSDQVCFPFTRYFQERVVLDPDFLAGDLFGISVVYDHQLLHAFHLARLLKKQWPNKKIVFGGTAITQLYKYMVDKNNMRKVFKYCDAIVVGEGETAICEMASVNGDFEGRRFPNTITYSRENDRLDFPAIHYENVSSLGSPVFDHPWHLYLSPERGVNYSPTRGCYWNRCTFCDYGLNTDKPTSPWRERTIAQVVDDLQSAKSAFGINYVYFAVDVMAPGYLERMSDAIVEAGLEIKWAAELRMEKIFTVERARKMLKAGCVCVSFGMESGNQRVLDLIDKGTNLAYMAATMKNFAAAGIACQLMAFTDFPTETADEKAATYEFISNTRDDWATGGLGAFLLTGTAMVAKHPEKFGISLIETQDADIRREVAYRVNGEEEQRLTLTEEADSSFGEHRGIFPEVLFRPWAGGTDSLHSMIYYNRYGRNFFKLTKLSQVVEVDGITDDELRTLSIVVNGSLVESKFDLREIVKSRGLYPLYIKDRVSVPAAPTLSSFEEWANAMPRAVAIDESNFWVVLDDKCGKLNRLVYKLLLSAVREPVPIAEIIARCPGDLRQRVFAYLLDLESNGFISIKDGDRVIKKAGAGDLAAARNSPFVPPPPWKLLPMKEGSVDTAQREPLKAFPVRILPSSSTIENS
jgi:anaerobic magnesium-protoporphyrin IX monomethyl ester cyclase